MKRFYKYKAAILLVFLLFNGISAQSENITYIYTPVEGKIIGVWPGSGIGVGIEGMRELRKKYGFTGLFIYDDWVSDTADKQHEWASTFDEELNGPIFENKYMLKPITAKHQLEMLVNKHDVGFYYIDEAVEQSNYNIDEIQFRTFYIDSVRPKSLFVISGYRSIRNNTYRNFARDNPNFHVMYSVYSNWQEYFGIWLSVGPDQRDSWTDMRNRFGEQFSMTWVNGRGDEYNQLFAHANKLNLIGMWLYGGSGLTYSRIKEFCESAVTYGWLNKLYIPDVVIPLLPENLSRVSFKNIHLTWLNKPDTQNYHLQIFADSSLNQIIFEDSTLSDTSIIIEELSKNLECYWRIRGKNLAGYGEWSTVSSFITVDRLMESPKLLFPTNNSKSQLFDIQFEWESTQDASEYNFLLSKNSLFNTIEIDTTLTQNSCLINSLDEGAEYFWKVKSIDEYSESNYSKANVFTTLLKPPILLKAEKDSNKIILNWENESSAKDGLIIEKRINYSENYFVLDSLISGELSYIESLAATDIVVEYIIKNFNEYTESAYSNIATLKCFPVAPKLLFPADSSYVQLNELVFHWDTTHNSISYHFQISLKSNFSSIFFEDPMLTANSISVSSLKNNQNYYWRVRTKNLAGYSNWSLPYLVKTAELVIKPVNLEYPVNNSLQNSVEIIFQWSPAADLRYYSYQVSLDSLFENNMVANEKVYTEKYSLGSLEEGVKYFWRVKAVGNNTNAEFSEIWSFTTKLFPPLDLRGEKLANDKVQLFWKDSSNNEEGYIIEKKTDFENFKIIDSLSANINNYTDTLLENEIINIYRVKCFNSIIASDYSNETTISFLPSVPNLILPPDSMIVYPKQFLLQWDSAKYASMYKIQVSEEAEFDFILFEDSTVVNTIRIDLNFNRKFFWRIKSLNPAGESEWSTVGLFFTMQEKLDAPTQLIPANNSFGITLMPEFEWEKIELATKYIFQLTADTLFDKKIIADTLSEKFYKHNSKLSEGSKYFWRVSAVNQFINSPYSDINNFVTMLYNPDSLEAKQNKDNVILTWKDYSNNENGFVIEKQYSQQNYVPIDTTKPNITVYLDSLNTGVQEIKYRVYCFTQFINSGYSNETVVQYITYLNDENIPENFSLSQNYPNPFNPTTTIEYYIPTFIGNNNNSSGINVKLILYDALGREITTLVNELKLPGKHKVKFNAESFPSGVYFYKIIANNYSDIKKLILVK
ncbi:MAG: T9SS type A sorting domain-containing protein [Bacteroidetes bacterium]|nr:T9SS type A sorting domain-containing protein [Bacteroidota bacterium]